MSVDIPRLRMFAGPNGSGKSTVKIGLRRPSSWFGIYINPDDLEKTIRETRVLELGAYGVNATTDEIRTYFSSSTFLKTRQLNTSFDGLEVRSGAVEFKGIQFNSYHASVLSDFLRRKAI